jgi:hypothetical protein
MLTGLCISGIMAQAEACSTPTSTYLPQPRLPGILGTMRADAMNEIAEQVNNASRSTE